MKHIVIINNYGSMNIGDYAIQSSGFNIIQKCLFADEQVSLVCENPAIFHYPKNFKQKPILAQLPYGSAVKPFRGKKIPSVIKFFRFIVIMLISIFLALTGKLSLNLLPKKGTYAYIYLLASADYIIGMGGGFFVSKNKITDFFGLLLTLLPMYIAKFYHKKILHLPLTFGPFASSIHQKLVLKIIKHTTFICRDIISVDRIKKSLGEKENIKFFYSPDLALHLPWNTNNSKKNKINSNYIVVTAREWLTPEGQIRYEQQLALFIQYMWNTYQIKTVFIPNAFNPAEENDYPIANRLQKKLQNQNIMNIVHVNDPFTAQKILSTARFAVCTRMHSAILAATVHTPFISIGYGIKGLGFVQTLDLNSWYIDMKDVSLEMLIEKSELLMKDSNLIRYINKLNTKLEEISAHKPKLIKEITEFIKS